MLGRGQINRLSICFPLLLPQCLGHLARPVWNEVKDEQIELFCMRVGIAKILMEFYIVTLKM